MYHEPACALAGVSYRQYLNWQNIAEDEGPESPHGIVSAALKVAEAEAENETVRYVRAASRLPQYWAAGATFLERRHPARWKRQDGPAVSVSVGVQVGIQAGDEDRARLLPDVVIRQIANNNADRSALGISQLSPGRESVTPPSPVSGMAVSVERDQAKAPPIEGVSPPGVA